MLIASIVGCKTGKESAIADVTTVPGEKQERNCYTEMIEAYGAWDTFVAKGNVSVAGFTSSFELRMVHNEAIQISLRPFLGIEAARMIITPDKVHVYEKLNKSVSSTDFDNIQAILPFAISFSNIQCVLLGKPFILGEEEITTENFKDFDIDMALPKWIMTPKVVPAQVTYMFDFDEQQLVQVSGGQEGVSQRFECKYSDYDTVMEHLLPTYIKVTIKDDTDSYEAEIAYTSASFNVPATIDNNPFKNYNEVYMLDLIKSFIK